MSTTKTFEINWFAAAGSALGAVSSAVLLSTLGAAGTLIGAALGSLIITVGGSIYTQSLQKTKAHVDTRRGAGRPGRPGPTTSPANDEPRTGSTTAQAHKPPAVPLGETLRGLPWTRLMWLAVGLFVAAMAVILVFELSTGRPVSSFTGGSNETRKGTTFSGLKPSSDNSPDAVTSEQPVAEESPGAIPSAEAQPTGNQPTEENPTDAKPTQEQPTKEPTPFEQPSDQQAPVETPAETPTVVEPSAEPPAVVEPPAEPGATDG